MINYISIISQAEYCHYAWVEIMILRFMIKSNKDPEASSLKRSGCLSDGSLINNRAVSEPPSAEHSGRHRWGWAGHHQHLSLSLSTPLLTAFTRI